MLLSIYFSIFNLFQIFNVNVVIVCLSLLLLLLNGQNQLVPALVRPSLSWFITFYCWWRILGLQFWTQLDHHRILRYRFYWQKLWRCLLLAKKEGPSVRKRFKEAQRIFGFMCGIIRTIKYVELSMYYDDIYQIYK